MINESTQLMERLDSKHKSILIVDDSSDFLKAVSLFIKKAGHNALLASNGEEAVSLYLKHQPDLVLMDERMPKMKGSEAFLKIKKSYPNANIIFVTAFSGDNSMAEFLNNGISDVIDKPINAKILGGILKKYLKV